LSSRREPGWDDLSVPADDPHRDDASGADGWVVVLPVKHARHGKRRLHGGPLRSTAADRSALARAIAIDALTVVRSCRLVRALVVVTGDPVVAASAREAGDDVLVGDDRGLDAAVQTGLARVAERWPGLGCAVLLADVPALRAEQLESALTAAAAHPRSFVPDLEGGGTVLLAARPGIEARPAFGAGSAARHERLGAVRLDLDLPGLRRDVDTLDDLRGAVALGVGPATRAVLAGTGLA
jgi:2-phospho-L-lactate/phosphoenolpyruvate guanylyltransferase